MSLCENVDLWTKSFPNINRRQSHSEGKQNQRPPTLLSILLKIVGKFRKRYHDGTYVGILQSKKDLVKTVFCRSDRCLNSNSYSPNIILRF